MFFRNCILLSVINVLVSQLFAFNHWVLNEGKILPKIDSPFYLLEPNNLVGFLDQIHHHETIERTYLELLRQRELMMERITYLMQFGIEVVEQANHVLDFYELENSITYTKLSNKYLKRINIKKKQDIPLQSTLPYCWQHVDFNIGLCCFDHLKSMSNIKQLRIEPEEELRDDDHEFTSEEFLHNILYGLETNPNSWKYHTLASYYWRMEGNAVEALECARRGVLLAPRKFKDIPLLSLGTILWRSEKLEDADIVLSASVDHAPQIAENHLTLGATLGMLYDFNRSIEHLEQAEKLDSSFIPKTRSVKKFVSCLENLNRKTAKMFSYLEYVKKEMSGLKSMKSKITTSHEKIIQQQVPLNARRMNVDATNEELLHRAQYCSPRTMAGTDKAVLFCDFYSELQMRLESKAVDIESLERDIIANSEAIRQRLSAEFHGQFGFDKTYSRNRNKES